MTTAEQLDALRGTLNRLEGRLDSQEALIAQLMMGYTEMWVSIQMLYEELLTTRSPEEQTAFLERLRQVRQDMFDQMQAVATDGLDNVDPTLAETLQRLVRDEPAATPTG